jgi:hypothetical protein
VTLKAGILKYKTAHSINLSHKLYLYIHVYMPEYSGNSLNVMLSHLLFPVLIPLNSYIIPHSIVTIIRIICQLMKYFIIYINKVSLYKPIWKVNALIKHGKENCASKHGTKAVLFMLFIIYTQPHQFMNAVLSHFLV